MKKFRFKNRHKNQRTVGNSEMKKQTSSPQIVDSIDETVKDIKMEEATMIDDLKKEPTAVCKNGKAVRYSDEFKEAVVMEVLNGLISKDGAKRKYGIGGKSTVLKWIRKHQNSDVMHSNQENEHQHIDKSIKDIEFQNLRLRRELELSKLKVRELNLMIDIAEIKTEVPIRKLLRQDSYEYSKEIGKKKSFLSLVRLLTTAKRFTSRMKQFVGL